MSAPKLLSTHPLCDAAGRMGVVAVQGQRWRVVTDARAIWAEHTEAPLSEGTRTWLDMTVRLLVPGHPFGRTTVAALRALGGEIPEPPACQMCGGTGEQQCSVCDGTGECSCVNCDQEHDCRRCRGKGVQTCLACGDARAKVPATVPVQVGQTVVDAKLLRRALAWAPEGHVVLRAGPINSTTSEDALQIDGTAWRAFVMPLRLAEHMVLATLDAEQQIGGAP